MKPLDCKYFKKLVVDALYNYDELADKDKQAFHRHLTTCPACALEYEEMAAVLDVMEQRQRPEMDEAFWDSYMTRLQEKIAKTEKEKTRRIFPRLIGAIERLAAEGKTWRWVLYPATAVLLVLVGIAIGRYIYLPSGIPPGKEEKLISRALPPGRGISPEVAEHFENLRPMLIDCANYSMKEEENGEAEFILVDKKTLKKLALQNYLLKKIAARDNNAALKQLLEELELILLEISNAETDENNGDNTRTETLRRVRDILTKNDLLFKMEIYNKHKNNRKTPLSI